MQVPLAQPSDMLTWHLLHTVAAAPCVRMHQADTDGAALLQDTMEGGWQASRTLGRG